MKVTFFKYKLPFTLPLKTSSTTFTHRQGIIVSCSESEVEYYGDIAPLPGYSNETLSEVEQDIKTFRGEILECFSSKNPVKSLSTLCEQEEFAPALQFGLDSVAYQLQAQRENQEISDYLFDAPKKTIAINALCSLHSQSFLQEVRQSINEGYQTIKFKVGIDFNGEIKRLKQIRDRFPDLTIRIDANRAWSTKAAVENCTKLSEVDIEYCEEPLKKPDANEYRLLSEKVNLPLALDESISSLSSWKNLLPYSSYLIIKPMLIGSFAKNFETKRLADTHYNKAIFTSSLESGIGRRMTAILASGLGSTQAAHGLSTGKILAKDVHSDISYISEGAYHLKEHNPRIDFRQLGEITSSLF